jgi:hypothetical protein
MSIFLDMPFMEIRAVEVEIAFCMVKKEPPGKGMQRWIFLMKPT